MNVSIEVELTVRIFAGVAQTGWRLCNLASRIWPLERTGTRAVLPTSRATLILDGILCDWLACTCLAFAVVARSQVENGAENGEALRTMRSVERRRFSTAPARARLKPGRRCERLDISNKNALFGESAFGTAIVFRH